MSPDWLDWVRRLQVIAQNGLTYADDPFDIERYKAIRQIAAEIGSRFSDTAHPILHNIFTEETGYATPKLGVRGAVFRDGRILLVRERYDGLWTLPGGWADIGETPSTAVTREIAEEAGLQTRPVKLAALLDRNKHVPKPHFQHMYKAFFICEPLDSAAAVSPGVETDAARFFAPDELPANLSLARVTPAQISLLFAHHADPTLPTAYD